MHMKQTMKVVKIFLALMVTEAFAQTPLESDFTYQGQLAFQQQLVDGGYDFRVSIYDAVINGNQLGSTLDLPEVEVSQGIFTINLDFGDAAFTGQEVFLEIEVRAHDSGAAYDLLTPRQKISNTPYAIHAQFVGLDAVSSAEILDGSVTNNDLADNSVIAAKIAPNAIGSSHIQSGAVGTAQIAIDAVTSNQIADNSIVGFDHIVSGSISGSLLTNNSINSDHIQVGAVDSSEIASNAVRSAEIDDFSIDSIDIAADAITNSKIADGAVGLIQMDDNSVGSNEIINGSIQSFDMGVNSINANHIVSNAVGSDEIAANAVGASEIASNAVGSSEIASNAVGTAELAANSVTAVKIQSNAVGSSEVNDLEVQLRISGQCDDGFYLQGINQDGSVNCAAVASDYDDVLRDITFVGQHNSIAMGTNGNPVIANYYSGPSTSLWIIICGNALCSAGNTLRQIDNSASVGTYNSVTIDASGAPIISYYDSSTKDLKFARCGNATCSSGNSHITLDSVAQVGQYTSIALGSDDLPIISYYDESNRDLKVTHCGNVSCSSGNTITTVDSSAEVGKHNDLAIGADGLPIISYYDEWNGNLKLIRCGNVACTSGNSISTLASTGDTGLNTSIAIGDDDDPVIAYYDKTEEEIKTIKCGNPTCSSGNVYNDVGFASTNHSVEVAIGTDGDPVISYDYASGGNDVLVVSKCYDQSCGLTYQALLLPTLNTLTIFHGMMISSAGRPIISYGNYSHRLKIYACGNPGCH